MKNNMKEIYIDVSIFIQAVLRDEKSCRQILSRIVNNEIKVITSVLSWDELVYIIRKFTNKDIAIVEGEKFLRFPNLTFISAKKEVINEAQQLVEKYNLQPRDAIHAATALINGCTEIISDDSDFDKVKGLKRIGIIN
ncbi:MAG: type II toxin-antitoxin system VapC family toxin [Nanoarchaeota archaeon]